MNWQLRQPTELKSEDDRSYIQNEIDQLTTEIDRVAETTKFNETYLLKGDKKQIKTRTFSIKRLYSHRRSLFVENGKVRH